MMNAFLMLLVFGLNISCRTTSILYFENKEFEKEVKIYLKELKKAQPEIISIVVESYKKNDSVFITLSNAYPDITLIKAYANYSGVTFCFAGTYPLNGYYKIINPDPVPSQLKSAYDDIMHGKRLGNYEPFTKDLAFYKGKIKRQ